MKIGLEAYMTTKPTLETAIDRFDKKFIFIEDGDYATSSAFITDDGLNKYGLEDIKQFIIQEQATLEALVRKEEREKINKYGRKYNKYPSRMLRSKHRYHKRINKKFNNCNLCRDEI